MLSINILFVEPPKHFEGPFEVYEHLGIYKMLFVMSLDERLFAEFALCINVGKILHSLFIITQLIDYTGMFNAKALSEELSPCRQQHLKF